MCGATSLMMKDNLIVVEHQVDGTRLIIIFDTYIFFFFFFAILTSQ